MYIGAMCKSEVWPQRRESNLPLIADHHHKNKKAARWAALGAIHLRFRADSNRCKRFCRPLPSHSATKPYHGNSEDN
jgi:hypothetical protein